MTEVFSVGVIACVVGSALLVRACFHYLSITNRLYAPGRLFEHFTTSLGRIHCRHFTASDRRRDELCIAVGGIGGGISYWEDFLEGLSDAAGMDILAIDMPGRGGSDCPHGVYDQDFVTGWVAAAASHPWALGRDIILLGHSYGGAVAAVAATQPSSLQGRVKTVVLLAPAGVSIRPLYGRFIHLTQLLPHPLCDLLVVAAQVGGWTLRYNFPQTVAAMSLGGDVKAQQFKTVEDPIFKCTPSDIMRRANAYSWQDWLQNPTFFRGYLKSIRDMPINGGLQAEFSRLQALADKFVLIVADNDEIIDSPGLCAWARVNTPKAKLVELPDIGHDPFWERPTLCVETVAAQLQGGE